MTRSGWIFVADAGRQSVLVFDHDGHCALEIRERPSQWPVWTLPVGLLAVDGAEFHANAGPWREKSPVAPDEWVLVSDLLGGTSVTLLGVVARPADPSEDAD